jgi:hypothetical protein
MRRNIIIYFFILLLTFIYNKKLDTMNISGEESEMDRLIKQRRIGLLSMFNQKTFVNKNNKTIVNNTNDKILNQTDEIKNIVENETNKDNILFNKKYHQQKYIGP